MSVATEREVKSLDQAMALLDEWIAAYRELEGQVARLDYAWAVRYRELEYEHHRLQALEYDLVAETAAARIANSECPF